MVFSIFDFFEIFCHFVLPTHFCFSSTRFCFRDAFAARSRRVLTPFSLYDFPPM
jgi:hypothetical protein